MSETLEWNPLGENTIRKCCLYNPMGWNSVDLSKNMTCISKYGGLIATVQDESDTSRSGKRPDVYVYNAAGREISVFKWNSGILLGIAWTHSDELLCLQEDGQVLLYNIFGIFQRTFTMGMECRENKVLEYEVFTSQHGTGIAVMNGLYRFLIVSNIDEPKVRMLADVPGLKRTPPSSWCVLSGPRSSKVLAANDNDIYLLDYGGQSFQQTPAALNSTPLSYIAMSVSVDGKHIVLFTDAGVLWMGSSDFQEKYCEFNTANGSRPKQLMWCCDSIASNSIANGLMPKNNIAVVIYRPKTILVVGPSKDWVKYTVEEDFKSQLGSAVLCPDVDGVHIVTANKHEFLQHVPESVQGIFKVGSMLPGALLNDAAKEYSHKSEKADEYLRMLIEKQQLEKAVEQCIHAASVEFQPRIQKLLLQAASFGKSFVPSPTLTELFVTTCQALRVLNAVRDFDTGVALSSAQLKHLTMDCLIDRLVLRRQFHLAYQICDYLKIPSDQGSSRILSHWACYKVQQTEVSDDSIANAIRGKLKSAVGVSYASIAEKSVECGKKELAIKLLEFEPRASEQVRLLSKLGKHTLALEKAVLSGNTDLTHSAIARLRERTNLADFLCAIRQHPVAYKLHLKYCRQQNERMLKDLHEQEDNFIELAHCYIHDSFGTFRPEERVMLLHSALDNFSKARDEYCTKATEEQLQLLHEQTNLEQDTESSYVEGSLHDTLHSLLTSNQIKKAEQLRKQFKVNDKRWWWLRITALGEQRNFAELESFSRSKKSPIGYIPFVEVCMNNHASEEVPKYISKVTQDKRVSALLKTGNVKYAADLAIQTKNLSDLDMVLKKCGPEHRAIAELVRTAMVQYQRR
ncbi:vacuolar protein sorting-associated protein 16 homolog [Clavelina lepadiformis]|uniref:vacuolar protein sorting-associated protein 16 homolog n=1 Tax=Clavelina lepadiformis TaxID=159417 RepID=UPI004040F5AA